MFLNSVASTCGSFQRKELVLCLTESEKKTRGVNLDHGPAQTYSQVQNPALSRAVGYFHYFIWELTIFFESNYTLVFPLKHINSSKHVCKKWLMSWDTPSPFSISWGDLPRNKCSVKTSHLKETDDTCEILLAHSTTVPAENFSLVQLLKSRHPHVSVCESAVSEAAHLCPLQEK